MTIFGGAGGIGSSVAFNLLLRPVTYDVVIVDTKPNMVTSHVMDMQDMAGVDGFSTVRAGTVEDAADSDIVILSAAVPLRLNTSRSVFLADNARIVEQLAVPLIESGWDGVLIMLTNPADALTTWLHQRTGSIGANCSDTRSTTVCVCAPGWARPWASPHIASRRGSSANTATGRYRCTTAFESTDHR